jgi:hypothetical protein
MSKYDAIFNCNTGLGINEVEITELEDDVTDLENLQSTYLLLDGTRPMTGNLNLNDNSINNINNADVTTLSIGDVAVTSSANEINILTGATVTSTQLNYNDLTTVGYGEANKSMVLDGSRNIQNVNTITSTSWVSTYAQINSSLNVDLITPITPATEIDIQSGNLNLNSNDLLGVNTLTTTNLSATTLQGDITGNNNSILGLEGLSAEAVQTTALAFPADSTFTIEETDAIAIAVTITPESGTDLITIGKNVSMGSNDISDVGTLYVSILKDPLNNIITLQNTLYGASTYGLQNMGGITCTSLTSTLTGATTYVSDIDMDNNDITNVGTLYVSILKDPLNNIITLQNTLYGASTYGLQNMGGITCTSLTSTLTGATTYVGNIDMNTLNINNVNQLTTDYLRGSSDIIDVNGQTFATPSSRLKLGSTWGCDLFGESHSMNVTTNGNGTIELIHGTSNGYTSISGYAGSGEIARFNTTASAIGDIDFYGDLDMNSKDIENVSTLYNTSSNLDFKVGNLYAFRWLHDAVVTMSLTSDQLLLAGECSPETLNVWSGLYADSTKTDLNGTHLIATEIWMDGTTPISFENSTGTTTYMSINGTSLDMSVNIDLNNNNLIAVNDIATNSISIYGTAITASGIQLNYNNVSLGTVTAGKTVTADASKNISGFAKLTGDDIELNSGAGIKAKFNTTVTNSPVFEFTHKGGAYYSVGGWNNIGGTKNGAYSSGDTTSNVNHILFYNPNGHIGGITTSGTTTAYNTTSDYRLKENINDLTYEGSANKILNVKPKSYNFKADKDLKCCGFIAHELQEIMPCAVTGEKDAYHMMDGERVEDYQSVDYSKLIPDLVRVVQGQNKMIRKLKDRLDILENNIEIH